MPEAKLRPDDSLELLKRHESLQVATSASAVKMTLLHFGSQGEA